MMLASWLGVVARCGRAPRQTLRRAGKRARKNVSNLRRILNMRRFLSGAFQTAKTYLHLARPPPNPTVAP